MVETAVSSSAGERILFIDGFRFLGDRTVVGSDPTLLGEWAAETPRCGCEFLEGSAFICDLRLVDGELGLLGGDAARFRRGEAGAAPPRRAAPDLAVCGGGGVFGEGFMRTIGARRRLRLGLGSKMRLRLWWEGLEGWRRPLSCRASRICFNDSRSFAGSSMPRIRRRRSISPQSAVDPPLLRFGSGNMSSASKKLFLWIDGGGGSFCEWGRGRGFFASLVTLASPGIGLSGKCFLGNPASRNRRCAGSRGTRDSDTDRRSSGGFDSAAALGGRASSPISRATTLGDRRSRPSPPESDRRRLSRENLGASRSFHGVFVPSNSNAESLAGDEGGGRLSGEEGQSHRSDGEVGPGIFKPPKKNRH